MKLISVLLVVVWLSAITGAVTLGLYDHPWMAIFVLIFGLWPSYSYKEDDSKKEES